MPLFSHGPGSSARPLQEARAEDCTSLGFKALLDALDSDRRYRVLDLGSAIGSNIEFLSGVASRIRIGDLYATLAELAFFERPEAAADTGLLELALPIPPDESFDIVLSWDLVNYLRTDDFRALVRHIEPHCPSGSYFFAMGSTLKEMPAVPVTFRIQDSQTLRYCLESQGTRPCPRYVPRDLALLMGGFRRHSSYMLRNGMQEYLFVRE